ncbi:MAG: hypothetical protein PHS98_01605 [Bacilli bacterium]|nr:hypothetical protein [Bacilli bacterium]
MEIHFFLDDSKLKMDAIALADNITEKWKINSLEELQLIITRAVIYKSKHPELTYQLGNIIRRAKSLSCGIINDHNHNFSSWEAVTPPRYKEQPHYTRVCSNCGITEDLYVEPEGVERVKAIS